MEVAKRKRGRPRKIHPLPDYDPGPIASTRVPDADPDPIDASAPDDDPDPIEPEPIDHDEPMGDEAADPRPDLVVAPPDHEPSINLTAGMFQELILAMKQSQHGSDAHPSLQIAIRAIEAQAKTTERLADEFKRTVRRSNDTHRNISAFTFDVRCETCRAIAAGDEEATHRDDKGRDLGAGHPKPMLRYDTFFCGGRQSDEQLTPLEVEMFNAFEGSKQARAGKWTADLARDGSRRRLMISVPARGYDDMISLPPLTQILAELLYGSDIASPDAAFARIAALEARIKELEGPRQAEARH